MENISVLFDGSSVIGFAEIQYSDLVLRPVKETLRKIPWHDGVFRVISRVQLLKRKTK